MMREHDPRWDMSYAQLVSYYLALGFTKAEAEWRAERNMDGKFDEETVGGIAYK